MIELTPKQQALATFKSNLHLPGGGFHSLIVELAREFQLPFQAVRKVLKQCQKEIEKKIKHNFDQITDGDLTQENWLIRIKQSLNVLAKDTLPLMATLKQNPLYIEILEAIASPTNEQWQQDDVRDKLAMLYEVVIYKSLIAMLYTSNLYWRISNDLYQMTPEKQSDLAGYPQHIEAINHLLTLSESIEHK